MCLFGACRPGQQAMSFQFWVSLSVVCCFDSRWEFQPAFQHCSSFSNSMAIKTVLFSAGVQGLKPFENPTILFFLWIGLHEPDGANFEWLCKKGLAQHSPPSFPSYFKILYSKSCKHRPLSSFLQMESWFFAKTQWLLEVPFLRPGSRVFENLAKFVNWINFWNFLESFRREIVLI